MVQQVSCPPLADECAASQFLLYGLYAAKAKHVKRNDIIGAEIAVEFLRDKVGRPRLARLDTVNDEIEILFERLDLWLVARLDAVLDRQVMKLKDIDQDVLCLGKMFRRLALQIDPNDVGLVGEQLGKIVPRETLFDGVRTFSVAKDLHSSGEL